MRTTSKSHGRVPGSANLFESPMRLLRTSSASVNRKQDSLVQLELKKPSCLVKQAALVDLAFFRSTLNGWTRRVQTWNTDEYLHIPYVCSNLVSTGEMSKANETAKTTNDRDTDHGINQENLVRWEQRLSLVNFLDDLAGEVGQFGSAHPFLLACRLSRPCCGQESNGNGTGRSCPQPLRA